MRVRLRFERIYGTKAQYGEKPRESPPGSPIILDDYPLPGERVIFHLGQPVEELYRTYQVARAGPCPLFSRNPLHEDNIEAVEAAILRRAQSEPLRDDLTRWNWYVTIIIERTIDVPDSQCTPSRWFSIDTEFAYRIEKEFLEYGSYQADFLVDHLAKHLFLVDFDAEYISGYLYAKLDVDDRVVFFTENGPPFRVPELTLTNATAPTTRPIHLCDVEQMRAVLSKLQTEGQMALAPLTPATLLTLVEKATESNLKGRALEELVSKLFSTISRLKVETRTRTATEEIDISIFNDTTDGFLAKEGAIILAECKNWSGKCGRDEFSLLEKKSENRRERCSLSFLISWNGFTYTIEKELLRSSRERLVIVPLEGNDLRKAVADNNFFDVIQTAWRNAVFT